MRTTLVFLATSVVIGWAGFRALLQLLRRVPKWAQDRVLATLLSMTATASLAGFLAPLGPTQPNPFTVGSVAVMVLTGILAMVEFKPRRALPSRHSRTPASLPPAAQKETLNFGAQVEMDFGEPPQEKRPENRGSPAPGDLGDRP